jgi:hypothetical protein
MVLKVFRCGLLVWVCWSKNSWVDGCHGLLFVLDVAAVGLILDLRV